MEFPPSEPPGEGRKPREHDVLAEEDSRNALFVRRLERIVKTTEPASRERLEAQRKLGELLAEKDPWRASIHARNVVTHCPEDDGAWAVLALAQAILGNHRYAAQAYRRALELAPENPWYAHNLGHLLDVALKRTDEAVSWLSLAHDLVPNNRSINASLAHALGQGGRVDEAKALLPRGREATQEEKSLLAWLDVMTDDKFRPRALSAPTSSPVTEERARVGEAQSAELLAGLDRTKTMTVMLQKGLASLPLTPRQRRTALLLLREPIVQALVHEGEESLAAAISYAIVYVEEIPLSPREVAATFRVPSRSLRARFTVLRRELGLKPGDERYASRRP